MTDFFFVFAAADVFGFTFYGLQFWGLGGEELGCNFKGDDSGAGLTTRLSVVRVALRWERELVNDKPVRAAHLRCKVLSYRHRSLLR